MMKKRGFLLVVLSMVMGVGAAYFANNWVQTRSGDVADSSSSTVTVMAAAMDIPYGTKVESRHMKAVQIPKEILPQDSVMSVEELEGWVTTSAVVEGEMLMKSRFAEHDIGSTLAALIGENMRAITVRVDDVVGVAGFLLPGNYVDVIATKVNRTTKTAKSETILKKIKVLAVDQTARTSDADPVLVRAVTLEMTAPQSEVLSKRRAEGEIGLTLRNPNDEVKVAKQAAPKKRVYRAPAPVAPEITIIRGTRTTKQKTSG
jgi:pilus assembly protein CpaB